MIGHCGVSRAILFATSAIAGSVLLAPSFAKAADAPAAPATVAASADVSEVVVTARGRVERLQDVPVSASVLSGQEIQRAGNSFADISTMIPSLRISRGGAGTGGSVSLRGVAGSISNSALEQKVALNLDGVQVGQARFTPMGFFDTKDVQVLKGPQSLYFGKNATAGVLSIESNDPARSSEGYVRAGYEFQAEEYQFEGAYSFPISDNLRVRIAGRYSDMTRGYVTNDAPVVFQTANNAFSGIAPFKTTPRTTDLLLRTTVVYQPTDNFDANFKITGGKIDVDGSKDNPGQPVCKPGAVNLGVVGGLPEPWDDCVLNDHVTNGVIPASQASHYQESGNGAGYDHIRVLLSTLKLNYKTEKYTITSVTGLANLKFNEFGDSTGSAYTYAVGGNAEVYQQYSEEVRLASTLQGPLNFTVGAFVQRVNRKATGSGIQNAGLGIDRGRQNSFNAYFKGNADTLSAFGQLNWNFLPEWELAVGARATQEKHNGQEGNLFLNHTLSTASSLPEGVFVGNSTDDKNISPEATLNWRPTETFMAYVAYRTASLAGGISSPSTLASTTTAANIVFKPEDAIGYEGGIKFTALDSRMHGNVTVFRTDYKNLQVAAFNPVTFSYILRNVGKARSQGVEVTGDFRVTSDFSLRGEATYADSKYLLFNNAQCYSGQTVATGCVAAVQNLSGKPLPRAPKFVASLSANYDHSLTHDWNIGLSADVRYSSSYNYIETENPVALQRAFTTLNLAARIHNGDWDLALIGRNVTNEFYADSGVDQPRGNNSQVYAIVARPRQVVLQLTRNF